MFLARRSRATSVHIFGLLLVCPVFILVSNATIAGGSDKGPPPTSQHEEFAIWPGKVVPGSETWTQKEVDYYSSPAPKMKMVRDVVNPTLTVYSPPRSKANGTAVIIAPGGALRFLSWQSEGTEVAEFLAARGVTAFVLKYRLVETPTDPVEFDQWLKAFFENMQQEVKDSQESKKVQEPPHGVSVSELAANDARQAVAYVRSHAAKWGIASERIGMIGFSTGAYVTLTTVMDHDAESKLNFAAVIYGGVIEGRSPPTDAPPLFLLVAQDDPLTYSGCQKLYAQWNDGGLPVEYHSFAQGGHGFGMVKQGLPVDHWGDLFAYWLDSLGLMKRGDVPHKSPT